MYGRRISPLQHPPPSPVSVDVLIPFLVGRAARNPGSSRSDRPAHPQETRGSPAAGESASAPVDREVHVQLNLVHYPGSSRCLPHRSTIVWFRKAANLSRRSIKCDPSWARIREVRRRGINLPIESGDIASVFLWFGSNRSRIQVWCVWDG